MRTGVLISAAALAATSACRGSAVPHTWDNHVPTAPTAALPAAHTAVIPGERFTWSVSMLGFEAGELVMAAGQPGDIDGRKVVIMRSRSQSRGVAALVKSEVDDVTVWLDVDSGHPLYHQAIAQIGNSTEEVEVHYAPGQFDVREQVDKRETVQTQTLPEGGIGHDLTSALMALRGWQASPGDRVTLDVLRETRIWQTHVQYGGEDSVKIAIGRFPAIRLDGVSRRLERSGAIEEGKEPRHFSIWLSDDASRVPLLIAAKTDLGDVRMELVEYESPTGTVIAAA